MSKPNRIAIYPGSFDPPTTGHIDLILRAAAQFDKLIVLVATNPSKHSFFLSADERVELLRESLSKYPLDNIEVAKSDQLVVDYCLESGATAIVRGIRSTIDFELESQMASVNAELYSRKTTTQARLETLLMISDPKYSCVSSTAVRELYYFRRHNDDYGEYSFMVPAPVAVYLQKKWIDAQTSGGTHAYSRC